MRAHEQADIASRLGLEQVRLGVILRRNYLHGFEPIVGQRAVLERQQRAGTELQVVQRRLAIEMDWAGRGGRGRDHERQDLRATGGLSRVRQRNNANSQDGGKDDR